MIKTGAKKQIIKKNTFIAPKIIPLESKKIIVKKVSVSPSPTEKILVENFVSLQKVIVDLAEKLTNLSSQTSKLLGLFETSAKTLVEKGFEDNKEMVQKLDALLNQNKIIAKGISLLHEAEEEIPQIQQPGQPPQQRLAPIQQPIFKTPLPQLPKPQIQVPQAQSPHPQQPRQPPKKAPINIQEYQKSISAS